MRRFAPALRPVTRHWPLLPVLLLAGLLRGWHLLPTFHFGDEAEYASVAVALSHDWRALSYPALEGFGPAPFVSQPPLLLYLFALAIQAFGLEAGPVLVSAILGTATVALVYALGVKLGGRMLGIAAGTVLAVLPDHVGLSRSGQLDAGFAFLVTLAMLAVVAYLDRPTTARATGAGLAIAATCLAKLPGILVVLPIGLVLGGVAIGLWSRAGRDPAAMTQLARLRRHALVAAVPSAVAASLYVLLLWHLGATRDLAAKLGWQADRVAGSSASGPSRPWHWYFTAPDIGLTVQAGLVLLAIAAAGLLLLAVSAWTSRRQRPQRWLVVAWALAFLAFFMASGRKEWFYLAPMLPALALAGGWCIQRAALATAWPRPDRVSPDGPRWRLGAVLATSLLVLAALTPGALAVDQRIGERDQYGAGVREAARWIHDEDPDAAQIGSLLGRFTLHLYNGQPTYHYFVNHTFLHAEAEAGRLVYVVRDPYLNLTYERDWMAAFVEQHGGVLAFEVATSEGKSVRVYRLQPGATD